MSLFALIGVAGAVANLAIMWALIHMGMDYVVAAVIAAEITIISNFLLQERFVFQDMRDSASGVWMRFPKSFSFNNAEALIRIPMLALMVQTWHISAVVAAAITLMVAFVVRFMFHSLVVYAPRKAGVAPSRARHIVEEFDVQSMSPGEL
jgi:dolichol-phosphate mannosyltransferase